MNIPVFESLIKVCGKTKCMSTKTVKASFAIDTGASHSFISHHLAKNLDEIVGPLFVCGVKVKTPTGISDSGHIDDLSICLAGSKKLCDHGIGVSPSTGGTENEIVLGSSFLQANRCVIDYPKKFLKCKGRSIKFR